MQWPNVNVHMCISAIYYCIHQSLCTQTVISCLNSVLYEWLLVCFIIIIIIKVLLLLLMF